MKRETLKAMAERCYERRGMLSCIGDSPSTVKRREERDELEEKREKEREKEREEAQKTEYQAVGVTMDGKNYYYQGQLVNIFLDIRANRSFYTLNMNLAGTF